MKDYNDSIFNSFFLNGHLQTIWASTFGKKIISNNTNIKFVRERWDTPDSDFIDIDWLQNEEPVKKLNPNPNPLLILFHGLEGSSQSQYSLAFAEVAREKGWSFVVVNFRGCSGEINLAPRSYHAGDSDEIDWIIQKFNSLPKLIGCDIFCIGVSLGGNALLKWIANHDKKNYSHVKNLKAIVSLSAPLDLIASGKNIDNGLNKFLYAKYFLKSMIIKAQKKWEQYPGLFNLGDVTRAKTIEEFDDSFTAPVHKFYGVIDYWKKSSSLPEVRYISSPTLVINAQNDPLVPYNSLKLLEVNCPNIEFWNPISGGHVGFPAKKSRFKLLYQFLHMPRLVLKWLDKFT